MIVSGLGLLHCASVDWVCGGLDRTLVPVVRGAPVVVSCGCGSVSSVCPGCRSWRGRSRGAPSKGDGRGAAIWLGAGGWSLSSAFGCGRIRVPAGSVNVLPVWRASCTARGCLSFRRFWPCGGLAVAHVVPLFVVWISVFSVWAVRIQVSGGVMSRRSTWVAVGSLWRRRFRV